MFLMSLIKQEMLPMPKNDSTNEHVAKAVHWRCEHYASVHTSSTIKAF